jgi:glycosyltransferase involved in cell wall biosynthesis
MRIAYFTSIYPRATDTFIQREVAGLREQGHEVLTISTNKPGREHLISPEVENIFDETYYLLPFNFLLLIWLNLRGALFNTKRYFNAWKIALKSARPGLKGFVYQLFYFQESLLLLDILNKHHIEHVHNHFGDSSGTITMLASLQSSVTYSITIHGPHIFFEPTIWALDLKLKYSKFIACISHYCKSQVMLFSNAADWHKLKIVHCGIDFNHYQSVQVGAPSPTAPLKLIYVGRLAPEKGVGVLIDSLIMLKEDSVHFELTLVGDGPERASLESLVKQHGLQDSILFHGFANQSVVRNKLLESDIFVLPSFAEGVPVSFMEAMASGIPVVGTNVGGVSELIEHGVTGLIVPPADEEALKKAISRYVTEPDLRTRIKLAARAYVEREFNLEKELLKLSRYISDTH